MEVRKIFSRQASLFGKKGQERLLNSTVCVVGLGGLGSVVCECLVRAGVGNLILMDFDRVSVSDLNRQILYSYRDIGKRKVDAASERLRSVFPEVKIRAVSKRLTKNSASFLRGDMVADCLDNFEARFFLDRLCSDKGLAFVHAGVEGLFGQVVTVLPEASRRLSDIYQGIGRSEKRPVALCPPVMVVGAVQALEILNFLLRGRDGLSFKDGLLFADLEHFSLDKIGLA